MSLQAPYPNTPDRRTEDPFALFATDVADAFGQTTSPAVDVLDGTADTDDEFSQAIANLASVFGARPVAGLTAGGWNRKDAHRFVTHLGRRVLHAAKDRNFRGAYKTTSAGERIPCMYPVDGPELEMRQYARLTHTQRAAVIVVDIDTTGTPGGRPENLPRQVVDVLDRLCRRAAGPAWVGVNPTNGHGQAIWLIDPVYRGQDSDSPNWRLLQATHAELCELLGADKHFSHGFSRWPLYLGTDPTAYQWHAQPDQPIIRVAELIEEVRAMTGKQAPTAAERLASTKDDYASGWERIEAAKRAREQAHQLAEAERATEIDDPETQVIDGIVVHWIDRQAGRAARDKTAFRHALKTAYHLHASGKRMTDRAILDAYLRAYQLAQEIGADFRPSEIPPTRDLNTMARRCRGYVISGKATPNGTTTGLPARKTHSTRGRHALATLGRRGAKTANARRWEDKTNPEAQAALKALDAANKRRSAEAKAGNLTIAQWYLSGFTERGEWPTVAEGVTEYGVSEKTVRRALKTAGIQLPKGRRNKR